MMGLFAARRRLPMVFQAETNECGLACLTMISGFYGQKFDLNGLRSRLGSNALGASARQLLELAEKLSLRGRAIKLELEDLPDLSLPAILHWDLDHFVVLKKLSRKSAHIHDPAVGVRRYAFDELSHHFTGVALELSPRANYSKAMEVSSLKLSELLESVKISLASMGLVFFMTLVLQVLAILNPLYLQLVIDQGLVKGDTELIFMLALLFVGLVILKTGLAHLRGVHLMHFGNYVGLQLVSGVARHLSALPLNYFERREMGDIVSRFGSLENIRRLITQEMITVLVDGLFSLLTLFLLYLYSPLLGSVVLITVAMFAVMRAFSLARERDLRQEALVVAAKQQTKFMENIRSVGVARINGVEPMRHNDWESSYTEQLNSSMRLERFQLSLGSIQSLMFGLENISIIYLGATLVTAGNLSIGQLMSFIFLKQHFTSSVLAMIPKLSDIRLLSLDLERIADVVQQQSEDTASDNSLLPAPRESDIQLRDLGFSYDGSEQQLLSEINFTFAQGQTTALVGPSGCGKSTLLKLILGLEKPVSGSVQIGGRNIKQINHRELRSMMSAVMHGDGLLSGDLAYNIHLGTESVDWERMDQLSAALGLEDFIVNLPLGYATEIGELGSILSAGQVQRILLARALYRQPKILLLDETLSNLGTEAAVKILDYIKREGLTLVLVTHNPELLGRADSILDLD